MRIRAFVVVAVTFMSLLAACGGGGKSTSNASGKKRSPITDCLKTGPYAVYVTNTFSNDVSIISDTTKQPIPASPVSVAPGSHPLAIALAPPGANAAYVADSQSNDVAKIDTTAPHTLVTPFTKVGKQPEDIAVSHNGAFALVANSASSTVSRLDISGSTPVVVDTIPVGAAPQNLAISQDDLHAVVSNSQSDTVSLLDMSRTGAAAVVDTLHLGGSFGAKGVAITSDNSYAYVVDQPTESLYEIKINANTLTSQGKIVLNGFGLSKVAINSTNTMAYAIAGTRLFAVKLPLASAGNPPPPITLSAGPDAIALTPDDHTAWVVASGGSKLVPIDLTTGTPTAGQVIKVGSFPLALAIGCDLSQYTSTTTSEATSGGSTGITGNTTTSAGASTSTTGKTTTTVQGLSLGCTDAHKGLENGHYTSGKITDPFSAGETLTVGVADITGAGSIAGQMVEFDLNPAPPGFTKMTRPVPPDHALFNYTFQTAWTGTASWDITPPQDTRGGDWEVDCTT